MAGIMLWFRWYMTQSEPLSVMTTQHEREDQRQHGPAAFGLRVHVQEVDHVHDDLHGGEAEDDEGRDGWSLSNTLPITSQNGIAVRITDSTKPVT